MYLKRLYKNIISLDTMKNRNKYCASDKRNILFDFITCINMFLKRLYKNIISLDTMKNRNKYCASGIFLIQLVK